MVTDSAVNGGGAPQAEIIVFNAHINVSHNGNTILDDFQSSDDSVTE